MLDALKDQRQVESDSCSLHTRTQIKQMNAFPISVLKIMSKIFSQYPWHGPLRRVDQDILHKYQLRWKELTRN